MKVLLLGVFASLVAPSLFGQKIFKNQTETISAIREKLHTIEYEKGNYNVFSYNRYDDFGSPKCSLP